MTKAKTKAAPAAQTRDEAESLVARIGEIQRELTRRDADLGDGVAKLKEAAERAAAPLKTELAQAQARVQGFCEANRAALTHGERTKTVQLATGKVSWRLRPPAVSVRGVEAIVSYLHSQGLVQFLRTKFEIDKEAMLKAPLQACLVPGVTIGSEGEDFVIEPFEAELVEARS
ncbi:MAG TPA: host-nuclease inhibitor Gam family protein [Caulobacteraceae bacterium]|nr:host-nuclease inhibitor Gam family protein [Caulobacteraceae bacterium]